MGGRKWNKEEVKFLNEKLGSLNLKETSKILNRTEYAVARKAVRLGILGVSQNIKGITVNDISCFTGKNKVFIYKEIKTKRLKVKKFKLEKSFIYVASKENFWRWAKERKNTIDWQETIPDYFGKEPSWVKEERLNTTRYIGNNKIWTKEDEDKLKTYYIKNMPMQEIYKRLGRTKNSIDNKLKRLDLKRRRKMQLKWQPVEVEMLKNMMNKGYTQSQMAEELGRTYPMVRSKIHQIKKAANKGNSKNTLIL